MNASPDLIRELEASRPTAPPALRTRVREIAARDDAPPRRSWMRLPGRRIALVALPAAAALALVSAGAIGIGRSGDAGETLGERFSADQAQRDAMEQRSPELTQPGTETLHGAVSPTDGGRAQRVAATLTIEVADPDAVSSAAQEALRLTRSLGGHVVTASVATGDTGSASIAVRVPTAKVQDAIVQLSALGRIAAQEVTVEDLQEPLDALVRRQQSVRQQIARISARLASPSLDAETRAGLEARRRTLRGELRALRTRVAATQAEARMATIQLSLVTPDGEGALPVPSRLERALDEALNILAWEGVVALAVAIVAAPFVLVGLAAWLGRRLYRRREEEQLLAAS